MSAIVPARALCDGLDAWWNQYVSFSGVTYGNSTFVAVGESGTILTFSDGVGWTPRTSGTTKDLTGVTYGNSTFVAVGYSGTIATSSDGVKWKPRTSGTTKNLAAVTYGNSTFVAVGETGTILRSGSIATTALTPTPTTTPASSPAPQPTPSVCTATEITASENAITIKKLKQSSVTITVTGDGNCEVKGEKVTAKVDASGKTMVSVTPASVKTGNDGSATFKLKAKSKTGATKVTFSTAGGVSSSVDVTIIK